MKLPAHRSLYLGLAVLIPIAVVLAACSDDDDTSTTEPSAEATAAAASLCRNIDAVRDSLQQIRSALIPPDPATLQSEQARLRALLDSLAANSEQSGGAVDQELEELLVSLRDFQRLLATPDLIRVVPELVSQITAITTHVEDVEEAAGCS